jgi:hypothetical protein
VTGVDPETKRALEAIDRVCETPTPVGPVQLEHEYMRSVERVEFLPENLPRADKTWIEVSDERWSSDYRAARPK